MDTGYIKKIEIHNMFFVKDLVMQPGALTRIRGTNESGKSSVPNAIKMLFQGGNKPNMLLAGAQKGYCRMTWETPIHQPGIVLEAEVTPTKASYSYYSALKGEKLPELPPFREFVNEHFKYCDPSVIVGMNGPELLAYLPQLLEMSVQATELGPALQYVTDIWYDGRETFDLPAIDRLYKHIDEKVRRAVNGAATQAKKTVERLAKQIPPAGIDVEALRRQKQAAEKERADLNSALIIEVNKITEQTEAAIEEARRDFESAAKAFRTRDAELKNAVRKEKGDAISAANERVGKLEAEMESAVAAESLRAEMDQAERDERQNNLKSMELSNVLEHLKELKRNKTEQVTQVVPELRIVDGVLMWRDLVWTEEVPNTQQRIFAAVMLMANAQGLQDKVPFLIMDGALNELDEANTQQLAAGLRQAGIQVIATELVKKLPEGSKQRGIEVVTDSLFSS